MIYTLPNLVNAAGGTPVPFTSTRTPANWVTVFALNGNTSDIFVGGVNPANKSQTVVKASTNSGIRLAKGTSQTFSTISVVTYIDLSQLFLDVITNNDGVSITYGIR